MKKNTFWQRKNDIEFPDKIEQVGTQILEAEDIISLMPDAFILFNLWHKRQLLLLIFMERLIFLSALNFIL
ncbi:MAG: hypothetical protein F6K22_03795 [Okeania sp. SIO2F4]|uniref:hypothetical protein n=1 Tax=Okeania sp. SIO2F4 TaxID=2607790 RepID=UPI00142C26D8|nr:hypothetical protein [Okeania sp. SIO2F4]NES02028.1 hypothetical protein [Okeania sp. SIO2F4]